MTNKQRRIFEAQMRETEYLMQANVDFNERPGTMPVTASAGRVVASLPMFDGILFTMRLDGMAKDLPYYCAFSAEAEATRRYGLKRLVHLIEACGLAYIGDTDETHGVRIMVVHRQGTVKGVYPLPNFEQRAPWWRRLWEALKEEW